MNPLDQLKEDIPAIEALLGYVFHSKQLLITALVHRSFVNECHEKPEHNERLEFLGDSVLGFFFADYLFEQHPSYSEGKLSRMRSLLVDAPACTRYMRKLGLEEYILLGKGEKLSVGRGRDTILADAFEALIGSIYLDGGIESARRFLMDYFMEEIEAMLEAPLRNFKAELQDYSQKKFQKPPEYHVIEESGPEHSKKFCVEVFIGGEAQGRGEGGSKKIAEQNAAAEAAAKIQGEF